MAGTIVCNTINTDTGLFSTNNAYQGIAKAWVNYNGVTTTITNSFNISSVTRNGTGDYTLNFATAMPNANYIGNQSAERSSTNAIRFCAPYIQSQTASQYRVTTTNGADASTDVTNLYVAIFSS